MTFIYFVMLTIHENSLYQEMLPVVAFASLGASVIEGLTFQFDNLFCPIAYMWLMMQSFEIMLSH